MKKAVSLLLCLVMVLGLFPIAAQAAPTTINTVQVFDIAPPTLGMPWDDSATVDSDEGYTIYNQPEWFDKTADRFLEKGDVFVADHVYSVSVWLEAKSDYVFAGDDLEPSVKASIDGTTAKAVKAYGYKAWAMVDITYTYAAVSAANVHKTVKVNFIKEPKIGVQAGFGAHSLKNEEGFSDCRMTWYEDGDFSTAFKGVFAENKSYTLEVTIEADEGYCFAYDAKEQKPDVQVFFNDKLGTTVGFNQRGQLVARIDYGNLGKALESVEGIITYNIKAPVAGEHPSYEAENQREDGLYVLDTEKPSSTKNGIIWYKVEQNDEPMKETDVFEAGGIYYVAISVKPKEGYQFALDSQGKLDLQGAINGYSAIIGGNEFSAFVGYSFQVPEEEKDPRTAISLVEATSDYPYICYMYGKHYAPHFTVTDGSPAEIHFTDWMVKKGNADWAALASDKIFSGGKVKINAQLRIDGEAGTRFVLADDVKLLVNGMEWTVTSAVRKDDTYSFVWVESPEIVPPDVEDAPTFTVTFDSMGGSAVPAAAKQYYNYGTAPVADPVRSGYTFEGWYLDKAYTEAFVFMTDANYNLKSYTHIQEDMTLYAKWAKEPEKPADTETPTQTENKTPFTDVATSAYYYEPVVWAVTEGITSGTSATTFSPDKTCTRAQVVTFLHRMVASPEPAAITMSFTDVKESDYFYKPVKWAFGSEITGGTSATTFSPNQDCTRAQVLTFLWRTAGQPKAEKTANPFTDLQKGSYYYDAVLWAVERGITSGTSATTFSPNLSCTRGQVVTFLYRFLHG